MGEAPSLKYQDSAEVKLDDDVEALLTPDTEKDENHNKANDDVVEFLNLDDIEVPDITGADSKLEKLTSEYTIAKNELSDLQQKWDDGELTEAEYNIETSVLERKMARLEGKIEVIANNKTAKITLKEAITNSYAGEWGEDPIDFEPNPDYELCYVVRNTNFHNDFNLDFSDVAQRYIKKSKAEKIALKKGDILIEKSGGSPIQPVGRVALVDDLPFDKPVVFSNFLQKSSSS
jgi:hypothetical protein